MIDHIGWHQIGRVILVEYSGTITIDTFIRVTQLTEKCAVKRVNAMSDATRND
jgi:hypothetical protein